GREALAQTMEEARRRLAREIADGGAEPQHEARRRIFGNEALERGLVLGREAVDPQRGVVGQQRARAVLEDAARDVDRDVSELALPREQRLDDVPRLRRAAAAELDELDARGQRRDDLRRAIPQDLVLGARRIVL